MRPSDFNPAGNQPHVPRVICIDDDPSFGRIIHAMGLKANVAVETFQSVDEVTRLSNKRVDVAIIDYDIGPVNGIELVNYLERLLGTIPIILVSQSEALETPHSAWPRSIKAFIPKARGHRAILAAAVAVVGMSHLTASVLSQ